MLSSVGSVFNVREILRVMKFPGVMEVFLVKVLSGLPIGKSHSLPWLLMYL